MPTANAGVIRDNAVQLLNKVRRPGKPIRGLYVFAWDLSTDKERQATLWDDLRQSEKKSRLDKSIDCLRNKYGYNVVQSARVLEHPYLCGQLEDSDFKPFKK